MQTKTIISFLAGCSALALSSQAARAESARDIMDKVANTRKLEGSEAVIKMTLIDEKGKKREREIAAATKLFDKGKTEKRVFRFLSPSDVKGTGFLVFDYEAKADDAWFYMPAFRKTRRILSSDTSKPFMGSEFTFGDLSPSAIDDYTYTMGKEESCTGGTCYVIEAKPKSKAADGYSKQTYYVNKSNYVPVKILYYGSNGKLLKEMIASKIKLLDKKNKRYRSLRNEMINKVNGRKSIFEFTKMTFSPKVKDDYFTQSFIERG